MYKKISYALLVLLILIFSLSFVSATDNNTLNELATDDSDTLISSSFSDLQTIIDEDTSGEINLTDDFIYSNSSININKTITINGNNHIIDANGASTIFTVTGSNVILNNLTITNINITSGKTNAIIWNGENGQLINSNISNNYIDQFLAALVYWNASNGIIDNCLFENNYISPYTGVSMPVLWFGDDGKITNSKFINNSGTDHAGAIYWGGGADNGIVYNCSFINNSAWYGGAIYWNGANGSVSKSYFKENSAISYLNNTFQGGAIYWYSQDDVGLVDECVFVSNVGSGGEAIAIGSNTFLTIENSFFINANNTNETNLINATSDSASAIANYNWWGNTVDNITVIPNVNGNVTVDNWLFLNATISADVIGIGYESVISFILGVYDVESSSVINENYDGLNQIVLNLTSVNGDLNKNTSYINENITFSGTALGNGSVTATFELVEYTIDIIINSTDPYVYIDDVEANYGDIITVVATYGNANNITAVLFDKNNNKTDANITVKDSVITITGLNAGNYTLNVTTEVDDNITPASDVANVIVNKAGSAVSVDDVEVTFGGIVNVTAVCVNASGINASLFDENGSAVDANMSVEDLNIVISNLSAGNYILNVTTVTDDNHYVSVNSSSVVVNKANSTITVSDVEVIYGDIVNVTAVCVNASGVNASVFDENGSVVNANITINDYDIVISNLSAGNYTLYVTTVTDDNHYVSVNSSSVVVNKANSTVSVDGVEVIYGDIVNVTAVCENATNISATLYDENGSVVDANITIDGLNIVISNLNAGNYTLYVTTVTDDNHYVSVNSSSVVVNKANSTVSVDGVEVIYGDIVNVTAVCVNASGVNASVLDVNGSVVDANISIDGLNIVISNLNAGNYTLYVTTLPDDNYNVSNSSSFIVVNKANSTIAVDDIIAGYGYIVNVTAVCVNASGVNASVFDENGSVVDANMSVDGFNILIVGLNYGNYTLNVTTITDDNYNPSSNTSNIFIKSGSSVFAEDTEITYGDIVNITAVCVNATGVNASVLDADGSVVDANITINDFEIVISDLKAGNYTLTLTTLVDSYHAPVSNSSLIVVNKAGSAVFISDVNVTYGDVVNVTAVCVNASGVNASVLDADGSVVDANITINDFEVLITGLNAGNYILNITSIVDDNHVISTNTSQIIVNKADITITLNSTGNINATEVESINVALSDDIDGELLYYINGEYAGIVEDNLITLNNLTEGTYVVLVELINDTNYNYASNYTQFNVSKVNYNISVEVDDIELNQNATILIYLPGDATGNVTVTLNNESEVININESTVKGLNGLLVMSLIKDSLDLGNYTVNVTYNGDSKYNKSNAIANFTVSKISDYNITIDNEDNILTINLPENATGNVTVQIGNNTYVSQVNGSVALVDLSDLENGDYNATITYSGDDIYDSLSFEANITISGEYSLIAPDVVKYYGGSERFYVYLYDDDSNPVADENVTITINNVSYTKTTDENGTASIAINLASGNYSVLITYNGTAVLTTNASVTILTTVNGTDVTKVYKNGTQYYATFRDSNGDYLASGTAVTFNINGVFYTRYISGNAGLARLNINLAAGEYIITAINNETGDKSSNNIVVISKIVENNDLVKYYKNDSQYTVRLVNDDGSYAGAGETVTFNINGVFYTRETNSSGYAKLNINLAAGDYIITAEYGDCKVSNNITVLPILSANDLSMSYKDGSTFDATLVDGQGNPLANARVIFNINGVFYTRYTSSSGVASLNINLMSGEYIITSSYNGCNIANTIKIS